MDAALIDERIRQLVEECRDRCLWFLIPDCYPVGAAQGARGARMALTGFQRTVCQLIDANRIAVIQCERRLQPFGLLAWAACGNDPGFSPASVVELAAKSARYTEADLAGLDFAGQAPDLGSLSREWHEIVERARSLVTIPPATEAGACLMTPTFELFRGDATALRSAVESDRVVYHHGSMEGALPQLR